MESSKFFLFGNPIKKSVSPIIHNYIFTNFNLSYNYELYETNNINDVVKKINEINTIGSSITIPFKEQIIPHINILSDSAIKIGAVNTILKENSILYGYNTDWIGIIKPLKDIYSNDWKQCKVLVLGAGGTARAAIYGLQTLNCKQIYIFNRTIEKAINLSQEFNCQYLENLNQINDIDIIISTLPSSINYILPSNILKLKPIIFDVNYYPKTTALTQQGIDYGCKTIRGIDMLIYQGIEQNKIWTKNEINFSKIKSDLNL
jgi:shikimate dehydrogenase